MAYLIIAYILNIIDYVFTAHWVNKFGIEIEANPLGRWMFNHNVAWVFKIFVVGGLFAVLGYFIKRYPKYAYTALVPLVVYGFTFLYHLVIAIIIYK